ncbi:MAG: type I methionyl aminopeptidase [Actinomycetota bacterium]
MIILKSPAEIEKMRRAGRIVAVTRQKVVDAVRPGITTDQLDRVADEHIRAEGATPNFKGYRGFPATICASINEQVVHGIPGKRVLKDGDLVSLDFGAIWESYHADSAITVFCGDPPSNEAEKLVRATEEALQAGISQVREGKRLSDIGHAVQQVVEGAGFSVVREYVGHGIGQSLHEDPQIPNYGDPGRGPALKPGMVLAIEPMVNLGGWETRVLADEWTVVTADGSLSAHFEHTVALTEDGSEVLTAG